MSIIGGIIGLFLGLALILLDILPQLPWFPSSVFYLFFGTGLVYDLIRIRRWLVSRTEKKPGEPTSESEAGKKQESKIDEYHI